ncbi:MAG: nickel-dependent lactate racemase [Candidatus Hermodarchaeota archaeon]
MRFDYGKNGLDITIDPTWNVDIFYSKQQEVINNPVQKIIESIENPIGSPTLKTIIEQKKTINYTCIVVNDATRPVPSHIILKGLIQKLNEYGINDDKILILIATGLHRSSREDELVRILGKDLRDRLKVIDHDATDMNSLIFIGESTDDIPIYVNKHYYKSDLKILTGYVEPHFFLGFSGGRKSIIPGIAGQETIQGNHSAENIDSNFARFGIYKENPMHKNANEIAKCVGSDFVINVCINEKHEITQIKSGNLEKVHEYLVNYQLKNVFKEIENPYDIVICGNGGYPLDLNLYQAVKSMAIGELAVKENGVIISVNELYDGVGHDNFKDLIFSGKAPETIYSQILSKEIIVPDQWEIQILTRILMKAEIFVISKLNDHEIGNIGLKYASSVEEAIQYGLEKFGLHARILILPNGPLLLPLLKNQN